MYNIGLWTEFLLKSAVRMLHAADYDLRILGGSKNVLQIRYLMSAAW